ncbi:MAG: DnaJ domain-containing protein [Bacilli bacterium]|nr:DnaJ domain-containing protein [Bacilli bacterium]
MKKNYYEILGVSKNATQKEIRAKYIELVKKYHPDINSSEDSTEIVQDINAAYDVLSNDKKRQEYDASLNQTNTSNIEEENEEVKEEPFNYEEEINKYTDREKKYAKKISVEKIIKDELLKAESIIKAKLEVIELVRQENMIEDFYFDKVEEFWEVSNNYVGSLEKLIETATDYNLDHLVVEINEKINLVNNNLDNMPLTIIDAVNYLENKENKERVESKIVNDINLVKNQLSSKTVFYDQIIDGYINEKNYDRYRESR